MPTSQLTVEVEPTSETVFLLNIPKSEHCPTQHFYIESATVTNF